jgi:hypothetical protein
MIGLRNDMFLSKFFHAIIDGRRTILECTENGFDELTQKCLPSLRRADLLKIAKSCNIKITKNMYDFEISDKIKNWKPSLPLCYSKRELIKLSKKEVFVIFKLYNLDTDGIKLKHDLIDFLLQLQML